MFGISDFFNIVEQCGAPVAIAVVCGWFLMQAIELVLTSVVKTIKKMTALIRSMDGRVRQMNIDALELDALISNSLLVDALPEKIHYDIATEMNKT